MEIEGFSEIVSIVTLAKELHDIGRNDILQTQFYDNLCYDSWFESAMGVITSIFSDYNSNFNEENEMETMVFTDDIISKYFCLAWEYGRNYNVCHKNNPYVTAAENEIRSLLNFTYNLDWNLLGYTKTKKAAMKSKLVVYTYANEFCEHDHSAYALIKLYQWFSDNCAELSNQLEPKRIEVVAA